MITHESLIDVCQEIGTVAKSNNLFTFGLASMLAEKTFETLTVVELLTYIDKRRVDFNHFYNRRACDE